MSTAPAKSRSEEQAPLRPVRLGPASVEVERKPDGTILLRSPRRPRALSGKTHQAAGALGGSRARAHFPRAARPHRRLAQRDLWAGVRERPRHRGGSFEARALAERPIAILSGNDIEHALLGLAAMHAGRALRADIGALFAGLARLQEAESDHRDFDAGSRLRRRRRQRSRPRSRRPCRRTWRWRSLPIRQATGR